MTQEGSDCDEWLEDCSQRLSDWQMDCDVTITNKGYVLPTFHNRRKERVVMLFSGMGCSPFMSLEDWGFLLTGMAT